MNLLMISGDRSILQGKKGAFWYTLEEMSRHWERIDVVCPYVSSSAIDSLLSDKRLVMSDEPTGGYRLTAFSNVFFHPSPHGLWYQPWWIFRTGKYLIQKHHHAVMSVHEYPPFYNGLGAEWLSRRTGVPYVLEVHHIVGYPKASSFTEKIGYALSRLFLVNDTYGAKAVRCVNRGVVDVLEFWGARSDQLYVVPSFYLDSAALIPDSSIEQKYDVVACGRLVANKGFDAVLRAIVLMPDVTLLLIGDGPLRGKLERLVRSLHIDDRVMVAGWLPESADVYRAIQSAKVFVMNSKSEGGPRVALEAMALGVPIVSTRVGVMPELIKGGASRNGYFTTGTPKDLAEKIGKVLAYPSLRERLGEEARAILDMFDRKRLIAQYAEFLKSMSNQS